MGFVITRLPPVYDRFPFRLLLLMLNTTLSFCCRGISTLDCKDIKPQMRGHLESVKISKELDEVVGSTTDAYMTRIERERKKKEKIIAYYRSKEKEIEDAFFEFSTGTERELDDCRYYIQSLTDGENTASKTKAGPTPMDRSFLTTEEGLKKWKEMLRKEEEAELKEREKRKEEIEKFVDGEAAERSQMMSYLDKLAILAEENPGVWRDLKKIEMERRLSEEEAEEQRLQRKAERDRDAKEQAERKERAWKNQITEKIDNIGVEVDNWWEVSAASGEAKESIISIRTRSLMAHTTHVLRTYVRPAWCAGGRQD